MDRPGDSQLRQLLDSAANGDSAAYGEVINLSAERVHRLTARMLQNYPHLRRWEETADVVQNALIRLHRSLEQVRPDSVRGFFGLAATQIRRTLIDLSRHHFGPMGAVANYQSNCGVQSRLGEQHARGEDPASLQDWSDFHESVGELDEEHREVFELVWYSGLTQAEIAKLLSISIPTVKRRLRRSRILLAQRLYDESGTRDQNDAR